MRKKHMLLYAIVFLAAAVCLAVAAGAEIVGGKCGESAVWSLNLDTRVLTISGTGEATQIQDWGESAARRTPESVVVEAGITSLGENALSLPNVKSISLPSTLTEVGDYAFSFASIESITLPDSVTSLGNAPFYYCRRLTSVQMPAKIERIMPSTFYECSSLTSVSFGEVASGTALRNTFHGCTSLSSVTLPKGTGWLHLTFEGCSSLSEVQLNDELFRIGTQAFAGCALRTVTFPASLTDLYNSAFEDCTQLSELHFLGDAPNVTGFVKYSDGRSVENLTGGDVSGITVYCYADAKGFPDGVWEGMPVKKQIRNGAAAATTAWENPFTDVAPTDDYYDAVEYVFTHNLFKGTSETTFEPSTTMTRAMFVTVLGRLAGVDVSKYEKSGFADVEAGQWYTPYVAWANECGVVQGYSATEFGTDDEVTIEQALVILQRYRALTEPDRVVPALSEDARASYTDYGQVSDWAAAAVEEALAAGYYTGDGDAHLLPATPAARSLVALLLYRLYA